VRQDVVCGLGPDEGLQRPFLPSMKPLIAAVSSLTLASVPRRIACLVMMPKKTSTNFSHDPEVGVKCSVIRGFLASHA